MIDINELRRLAQAATPGPWEINSRSNVSFEKGVVEINAPEWVAFAGVWGVSGHKESVEGAANAVFIAAANPSAISELLGRFEAVEKERDAMRTALTDLLNDLEERAKWNLEESQRVVACGNGVYVRAKAALEESK